VVTTLGDVAASSRDMAIEAPTIVVVGEVARLQAMLDWR
jgi:siroheme synthase